MKPSIVHRSFAHGFKVATCGGAFVGAAWVVSTCEGLSIWTFVALLAALPLGWLAGAILLWPLLETLGSRINGAPWSEGDRVHILIGKNRGHIGCIYDIWPSRNQVRVDVSEQSKKDVTDVYFYNEICRDRP